MYKIKVLIADDHPIFRVGLVNVIKQNPKIDMVNEAENGEQALAMIRELKPDVAVLDVEMPGLNGLQVCEILNEENCPTKILILTLFKEISIYNKAMEIGAMGYLLKEHAPGELITAIETIARGEKYISHALQASLTQGKSHLIVDPKIKEVVDKLSNTEKKILKLIAEQKTTKEIAGKLFISEKTVENHRYNINKKLGLEGGQNNLLKFAIENKALID